MKLKGQVALISGAASGIGRATSKLLGQEGATVVAFDIDEKRGLRLAAELKALGIRYLFLLGDVRSFSDISRSVETARKELKRIDILFNNAGIRPRRPLVELDEEDWDRAFDTNVKGTFLLSKAVIPIMERAKKGVIVNTASELALVGHVGFSAYGASKAAIVSLTKTMALECAPKGIRVNSISPGPVDTPMLWRDRKDTPGVRQSLSARQPLRRIAEPEEIARAVLFLVSEESSFCTGSNLVVDGGFTAGASHAVPVSQPKNRVIHSTRRQAK